MIRGYPRHASMMPGDTLTLHVATDRPRFRVAFYRWGDGPALAWRTGWLPDRRVERITRKVLDRLGRHAASCSGLC